MIFFLKMYVCLLKQKKEYNAYRLNERCGFDLEVNGVHIILYKLVKMNESLNTYTLVEYEGNTGGSLIKRTFRCV